MTAKGIAKNTTREKLAALIVQKLHHHNIKAVLVGGSVVSMYTHNRYESNDLDFISPAAHDRIITAMAELGFTQNGKDFVHPNTKFTVEFPTGPLAIGDEEPVTAEGTMSIDGVEITLLSPTQSVMDRLAAFFHWNDRQCLDQALWIAEVQPIDLEKVRAWAAKERHEGKFQVFFNRLKKEG